MHTRIIIRPELARVVVKPEQQRTAQCAVIGVDLSLRGTGLVVLLDGELHEAGSWTDKKGLQAKHKRFLSWFKMSKNTEPDRWHRIDLIASWVVGKVIEAGKLSNGNAHVALEGYAFSKRTTGLSDIHELGGVLKGWLWSRGVPFRTYDPMSVKLAWTGNGHAEKDAMVAAALRRFPALEALGLKALAGVDMDAASNAADASLLAALLYEELELKHGRSRLDGIKESLRRVMIRTTKSEPEALVSRELIWPEAANPPEPVLARNR